MFKNYQIFGGMVFSIIILSLFSISSVYAEVQSNETEILPIDATIALEKTTLTFNVPDNNLLPWAFVEGKIANAVLDYPVVIQIFDDDDLLSNGNNVGAVHFAQTKINDDGTYEYKFRVAGIDDGELVNIFKGDYTVKVFKVVYLDHCPYCNLEARTRVSSTISINLSRAFSSVTELSFTISAVIKTAFGFVIILKYDIN